MELGIQLWYDQVDQQVDQDEIEGGDYYYCLQYGDILVIDCLLGQLVEVVVVEDGFGDQCFGNQFVEQQFGNIQCWQQGIFYYMVLEDVCFVYVFGVGDCDEGLNCYLIYVVYQDLCQWGGNGQCDGDNW